MRIVYHVGRHDGGYGYRLDEVWSETYPDHKEALAAANAAAQRQHLVGNSAEISYQMPDGNWKTEYVNGADRPSPIVVDDQ